jgi:hypothetical protein
MANVIRNLWSYSRRAAIITAPVILPAVIVLVAITRARMSGARPSAISVPPNICVPRFPLPDSDSAEIIPTHRKAVRSEVVVIDLHIRLTSVGSPGDRNL